MLSDFEKAFDVIIGVEGRYSNDANDPGGETMYGISKKAYPLEDIGALTKARAKELYKRDYWDKVKGDQLPHPLCLFAFDAAVNQGVDAAIKMLQKSLGVPQDGIIGGATLAKAEKASPEIACLFMADRALRYTGTRGFDNFGRGWFKRLFVIMRAA